jgi:hypothetical protein
MESLNNALSLAACFSFFGVLYLRLWETHEYGQRAEMLAIEQMNEFKQRLKEGDI